jgi:circadian clock protein KaiC
VKKRGDQRKTNPATLPKAPTGIQGLDDITEGGLPLGRPTLICGCAGSGKTLFAIEFLVRGATEYNEPSVFMAFEETSEELAQNVASLGFDLKDLAAQKRMIVDFVSIQRSEILETGEYDLEGLFVRLGYAIDSIGAKRVVLDSLETLFSGLSNGAILRAELGRLFHWLKAKGVTAVITAERGDGKLTRHGLEEYVSDCVILLDNRVSNQFATRRVRVVKYRGSRHGTDEYPFLIGERGLSVLPITSVGLTHEAPTDRIPSGVPRLDTMLGGKGYFRGSSILVSGTAGTGKTSLSAHLIDATCRRGERSLVFLFEESPSQLLRNMRSIGLDLDLWIRKGLLLLHAARPTLYGLESHLVTMHKVTDEFKPNVVVMDPVTNLSSGGTVNEAKSLLTRLIDYFKTKQITTFFTSLTAGERSEEATDIGISSLMDTWLLVRDMESNGERNRVLYVLKSRGMAHSNQVREFRLTNRGIDLVDVYVGPGGVLTGTARLAQQAREAADQQACEVAFLTRKRQLDRNCLALSSQIKALHLDLENAQEELKKISAQEQFRTATDAQVRAVMARARYADPLANGAHPTNAHPRKEV